MLIHLESAGHFGQMGLVLLTEKSKQQSDVTGSNAGGVCIA